MHTSGRVDSQQSICWFDGVIANSWREFREIGNMSKDYQDDWNRSPEIETLDDNNEKGHDSWLLMDKSTSNFFPSGQEEQRGSFTYFDLNDKNDQALPASSTPTYMMDLEYTNSSRLAELQSANTYDTFSMGDPSISAINNSPGRVNKQVGVVTPRPLSTGALDGFESKLEASKSNIMSIINLLNEHVLSYPFIIIRRQAQVNNRSIAYHLTPFTVIPLMVGLQGRQGIGAFFKGLPSSLVNYVLLIGSESLFYNLLEFPNEYDFGINQLFSERLLKHLALKALSIAVVTPFICSGSVETVQSLIVSESPSPWDSILEGLSRIFHFRNDRKLPIYMLIGPSIAYHLAYYLIYKLSKETLLYLHRKSDDDKGNTTKLNRRRNSKRSKHKSGEIILEDQTEDKQQQVDKMVPKPGNDKKDFLNELKCSLYANIIADVVLYPFQTVLYRLFLQGTRTLIDNVDGRTAVIPLITNYESASDCYNSIMKYEGNAGLFKGFGALILQYSLQASLIQLTNYFVENIFA
ncbi:hypothetical protein RDWZM_004817 [Blomia tropicalis]|uniref:Uncharacterized protein n=1 Tax=Blomia tropicalis TaxID=40697 RepID=A0A9Q0M7R4_BLOTA|nr:hypothetical protein RDWZM_004817 [Blomia tropicalis]